MYLYAAVNRSRSKGWNSVESTMAEILGRKNPEIASFCTLKVQFYSGIDLMSGFSRQER